MYDAEYLTVGRRDSNPQVMAKVKASGDAHPSDASMTEYAPRLFVCEVTSSKSNTETTTTTKYEWRRVGYCQRRRL